MTRPALGDSGSTWIRAGQVAPFSGVLLRPDKAAAAEAVIDERDVLLKEVNARARETVAQATLADSFREQLVIERERSRDFRAGRDKAERGWRYERKRGKVRYGKGILAGLALKTGNPILMAIAAIVGR